MSLCGSALLLNAPTLTSASNRGRVRLDMILNRISPSVKCIVFSAGINGSDVAVVRTARPSYSRRQLGFDAYELPLRMTDSPLSGQASQSQLRTLVLTIESTNEHQMQEEPESRMGAIAYTYLGMFDDVSCGRTYVRDEDDWDLDDKTFTCEDGCVSDDSTYFAFL